MPKLKRPTTPKAPAHDRDRAKALADFVSWTAQHIRGDEKGEAQLFLDRLFQAFSQPGLLEVGGKPEFRIKPAAEDDGGTRFADYVWKPVVLIEMKRRGVDLAKHTQQVFRYWTALAPGRPRYVVLCNFDEFWIYDPEESIYEPADKLTLAELPERYAPLAFLYPTGEAPHFKTDRLAVTRAAADSLAHCFNSLISKKRAVPRPDAQRFILQMLVALFAEDINLLPRYFVTDLLKECTDPPTTFDLLGGLFTAMNTPGGARGGRFKGVDYFNGGLFSVPTPLELTATELHFLKLAATEYDWSKVSPDIFGTIFQHSMEKEERHAFGAHYTTQEDILKIVRPTIIDPFTTLIARAQTLRDLSAVRARLQSLRVLDPACGSGNFLYVAYREMRRLENEIVLKENKIRGHGGQTVLGGVSPAQFFGLDILPFAVELAKVTLAIAPKLASDELHTTEPVLPLVNLDDNIQARDALIDKDGSPTKWPAADVIIGNPPFLGAKRLKPEHGADYVNAVREAYPDVPGMADYCVYWFRKAHDHLPVCTDSNPTSGRAGLVGTQNIRNNQSRVGGLDHIAKTGVIVEAVENQPWSGEANVHVSIANWVKTAPSREHTRAASESGQPEGLQISSRGHSKPARGGRATPPEPAYPDSSDFEGVGLAPAANLDEAALLIPSVRRMWSRVDPASPLFEANGEKRPKVVTRGKRGEARKDKSYELAASEVGVINSGLSAVFDVSGARRLICNVEPHLVYQGVTPGNDGFVLSPVAYRALTKDDPGSSPVIHGYVTGDDILDGAPLVGRFLIDFEQRDVLSAQAFRAAFLHVQKHVLPEVAEKAKNEEASESARTLYMQHWWRLWRPRTEFVSGLTRLQGRFIACSRVTKRPVFVFLTTGIRPSDKVQAFLLDDDYSFSVLQSSAHWEWFVQKCSKLTERFSYSTQSVFATFPWPQSPTKKQIKAVAAAGREVRRIRAEALPKLKGGLRALYRTLELPGANPLQDAHAALDAAVLDAYGFSPKKDLLKQLLDLNLTVAAAIDRGDDVTAPGVPPSFGDPAAGGLITDDCIRP